jgi:hypothetical protein
MFRNPTRIRNETAVLLGLVVVLGLFFAIRQTRIGRLEAALARYQKQHNQKLELLLDRQIALAPVDGETLTAFLVRVQQRYGKAGYGKASDLRFVVDPAGIVRADQSLISTVRLPEPGGSLPVRDHLQSALGPMGLGILVKDGAIVVTSQKRIGEAATGEDAD